MRVKVKRNIIYKLKLLNAGDVVDLVEDEYLRRQIEAGFIEPVEGGTHGVDKEYAKEKKTATTETENEETTNTEATTKEESTKREKEHGDRGVVCPVCGKSYKTVASLKRHLRRAHKLTAEEIDELLK